MRTILLTLMFFCLTKNSDAQTSSLVGAWYWSNSSNEISMVLKKSGIIELHSGNKGEPILVANLKTGKYVFENGILAVTWKDNTIESYEIKFKEKDSFLIKSSMKKGATIKSNLTFNKIVDEEVVTKPL